jgi:hypothetical protein
VFLECFFRVLLSEALDNKGFILAVSRLHGALACFLPTGK